MAEPQPDMPVARRHVLATWGMTADDLGRRLDQMGLDDVGVRAEVLGDDGRTVRLGLVAEDLDRLQWGVGLVRAGLGDVVVGDDGATIEGQVVELLRRQGLTAGTAESFTGGEMAERLSEPSGSSEVFSGGIVSYPSGPEPGGVRGLDVLDLLDLLDLRDRSVASADEAIAMAEEAARALATDVAVAATGVAAPTGPDGAVVGTVFVGSWLDGEARATGLVLGGTWEQIRLVSASHALDHLRHRLLARERRRHVRA